MPQKRLVLALCLLLVFPASVWARPQKAIPLIETMPDLPEPFEVRDWKQTARDYDQLVFDFAQEGPFLPLIEWDENPVNFRQKSFFLPSYVGDYRMKPGSQEGINLIAAVVGASLVGVDKSDQYGENWVLMLKEFYNHTNGLNLVLNHSRSNTNSHWYTVFPSMLFFMVLDLYPELGDVKTPLITGGTLSMNEIAERTATTALDTVDSLPVSGEVDGEAGLAWLFYQAYLKWQDERFLQAAVSCLVHLTDLDTNPFYEVLLPYGVQTAARLSVEQGLQLDIDKLLQWCFTPSDVRRGWGVISDRWGDYDIHGLVGSQTDGGGYAFAMNTFQAVPALLPVLRYDPRYADVLGKWAWQVINNAGFFYPDELPSELQSNPEWLPFSQGAVAYEGLRKEERGQTPYATGDAIKESWAATNYALYGASHVGFLAGLISDWDGDVLKLDLCKTDFGGKKSYPTFLYYNPQEHPVTITIDSTTYDLVTKEFSKEQITLPAQQGAVLVVLPDDSKPNYQGNTMLVNGVAADYMVNMLAFAYPKEGDLVWGEFTPQLDLILQGGKEVAEVTFYLDEEEIYRDSKLPTDLSIDTNRHKDQSWHELEVRVILTTEVILRDKVRFQVDNSILGRAKADDLANWIPHGVEIIRQNHALSIKPHDQTGMLLSPLLTLDPDTNLVLEIDGILAKAPWRVFLIILDETYPLTDLEARSGKVVVDITAQLPASLGATHTARLALVVHGETTLFRKGIVLGSGFKSHRQAVAGRSINESDTPDSYESCCFDCRLIDDFNLKHCQ